ncbi:cell division protein FtsA [Clostridium amylolyticum]|uniref:Cell division protein FtsA n=1 Tax=Clostridium amylolyticum TaxID=1121298 RepID=A0A1M6MQK8_9CLOT|nr:cell division FtsA domain-containing protein [Clostridium amylolyticum]SHJ85563.1 cell division protein FtsA [Clostridium amylolyticum]
MISDNEYLFALDIGTRSVKGVLGKVENEKFKVICEKIIEHEERAMIDGQIHDINKVAQVVLKIKKYMESKTGIIIKEAAIAAAGRFLKTVLSKSSMELEENKEINNEIIRALELSAVSLGETTINKDNTGRLYCVGYSVKNYYLNGYIISNLIGHKGENIEVEVIATFLPKSVVESLYSVMNKVDLKVINMTLEPIAAMEAVIPKRLRLLNIALVDIGAGTSDIAISSNASISAFGMVPKAGDEITEVLAQYLMVDFAMAEEIKKKLNFKEKIIYTDVLGLENEVDPSDLMKVVSPIIIKIAEEVGNKIIELNNGKSPGAVFLIGGGSYTPTISEVLSKVLNISPKRIAIKTRETVEDCICEDLSAGSIGVTVLGIALSALKNIGKDFLNIYLNNNIISLFNTRNNTVKDVLLNGGINPKLLVYKNGNNIRFTLNNNKRIAFGELGKSAEIYVNGKQSTLDTLIKNEDDISFISAKDGQDASPRISEYMVEYDSKMVIYNGENIYLDPHINVNGKEEDINYVIKQGDIIEINNITTLNDFFNIYIKDSNLLNRIKVNGNKYTLEYNIREGDHISCEEVVNKEEYHQMNSTKNICDNNISEKTIKVTVNDNECILKGKNSYIFIDIFNYIDFDLSSAKGIITLELNGKSASYYDELKEGDNIKVYWK